MRQRTVKTKIKQLVMVLGGVNKVARKLMITPSYVYRLEKGALPGYRLYRDICNLIKDLIK